MKVRQAGTYQQPLIIIDETASKLSEGLDKAGKSYINQQENIRLSKDAIAEDIAALDDSMSEIGSVEGQDFPESARLAMQNSIDELQDLQMRSIGRDQTAVIKKKREIKNLMNQFGIAVGMMDEELKAFKDAVNNGAEKNILNSTDPNLRKAFRDMQINGGANWKMEAVDGNWVMSYKDPQTGEVSNINMRNYLNAKENGAGNLIKYTQDKSADYINEAKSLPAYGQVADLTKKIQTAMINGDDELVTTLTKDLTNAYNNLKNAVSTNTTIQSMVDENDWQNFEVEPGTAWENTKDQRLRTQNNITGYIMNQLMPTDAQGNPMNLIDVSVTETPRKRASEAELEREKTKRIEARLKFKTEGAKLTYQREQDEGRENAVEYDVNRHLLFADQLEALPQNSEERAELTVKILNEAAAGDDVYTYEKEDGNFNIYDGEGEKVTSMNTRNGIVDTLNGLTIMAYGEQSDLDDKQQIINRLMKQDELQKAFNKKWANAKKGDVVVGPDGKKYKKP